jgi:hypothetical protein
VPEGTILRGRVNIPPGDNTGRCPTTTAPFNWIEQPWRLPAEQSVRIRHRVVTFAGDPREAGLEQLYRDWAGA